MIEKKDSDLQNKNDLIEQADKVILEFNAEKHLIKAKFEHLMHLLGHV